MPHWTTGVNCFELCSFLFYKRVVTDAAKVRPRIPPTARMICVIRESSVVGSTPN